MSLADDNSDVHGLNNTAKPPGPRQSPPATCVGTARTVSLPHGLLPLPFAPSHSRMADVPRAQARHVLHMTSALPHHTEDTRMKLLLARQWRWMHALTRFAFFLLVRIWKAPFVSMQAAYLVPEQRSRPPATPKRAGSPSSSAQEIRRVKLTVPEQNQGVAPVDPDNAPGKRSELEPVPSGDIANLPTEPTANATPETGGSAKVRLQGEGDEDGGDVSMGEGGDDDADSGDDNDDEDPTQLEACAATSARARTYDQHVAITNATAGDGAYIKRTKGNGGELNEIVVLVVPHDEHDYLGVARGGGSRRRVLMATRSRVDHRRGQRRRSARGDAAIGDDE
ncbi:hypothetical protein DFH11DRAFT_1822645 [Phellopilus nigrolimitatus]|nr:hypothetical protein DFH11DRAFT_1822645 [Phellopilus nigrolimitatus]